MLTLSSVESSVYATLVAIFTNERGISNLFAESGAPALLADCSTKL
jgi:hypothetical protein